MNKVDGIFGSMVFNEAAMQAFEAMTETQKQAVLHRAHAVGSKREMQQLVAGLTGQHVPPGIL